MKPIHLSRKTLEAIAALVTAMVVIAMIDRMTNRLDALKGHVWDFVYYIDMAENGVFGNDHLASPYAYRAMTPLLARAINLTFGTPTIFGFKVLGYAGVWMELFGIYLLARHFKTGFVQGLVIMLAPACALFNAKFLLFDFYRPDQLGYAFLVFAFLAALKKKKGLCLVLSLIGLNTREFLIIPPLIMVYETLRQPAALTPVWKKILQTAGILGLAGFMLLLPRLVIPVKFTQQIVDPVNDPEFFNRLVGLLTNLPRNYNYMFNLAAYGLPLWMLATPGRITAAWGKLKDFHVWICIYTAVTLAGMMIGGTDMMRYVTYFFIPLALMLILILRDSAVKPIEIWVMFAAVILFNRILFPFPIWDFSEYVNFYGGYGDWVNKRSVLRLVELFSYVGIGFLMRRWLGKREISRESEKIHL